VSAEVAAGAAELGRLRWRCRRGMRELDVLLTNYLDSQFQAAPAGEQAAFRALLESQDTVIHAYCLGTETPPDATTRALIGRLTSGPHHER
jgi:antitoxin CptB